MMEKLKASIVRLVFVFLVWSILQIPTVCCAANSLDSGLVGYWKLEGDCNDYSGNGNHGTNRGVDLTATGRRGLENTAAEFNGRDSYIEVPNSESLNLKTDDFSISVWIYTDEDEDTVGDVLSKYRLKDRRGFNFGVLSHQYRFPANFRNVFFGIDNGQETIWQDCGNIAAPKSVGVWSLCVHKGKLYAGSYTRNNGSYVEGLNPQGHVYRYEEGTKWTDLGRLGKSSNVLCLASYKGDLYGAVAYDETDGDLVGKIYRYDEAGGKWIDCGQIEGTRVVGMAILNGKLYAGASEVFRYEGGKKWTGIGGDGVVSMGVYNDNLFISNSRVSRYDGRRKWTDYGPVPPPRQTWAMASYYGRFHIGDWPKGRILRYEDRTNWIECGRLIPSPPDGGTMWTNPEVMALVVYNGSLYGSIWPTGGVYRYNGGQEWDHLGNLAQYGRGSEINWHYETFVDTKTGRKNYGYASNLKEERPPKNYAVSTAQPNFSRTPALAVYQGKVFAGAWNAAYDLPGHVYCMEAGVSVSDDYELQAGWKHLAVVKGNNRVRLYIDGKLSATSTTFMPEGYNISNDEDLKIGFGTSTFFKGKMNQVRIYNRALSEEEINTLTGMRS